MTFQDRICRAWAWMKEPRTRNLAIVLGVSESSVYGWRSGNEPGALALSAVEPRLLELEAEMETDSQSGGMDNENQA